MAFLRAVVDVALLWNAHRLGSAALSKMAAQSDREARTTKKKRLSGTEVSTYKFVRMKMIWKYALKLYDGEPYDVRNKLQTNGMLVVAIDA